jgi:hypothetical protein
MAETRLADVIIPEVFTAYSMEDTIYRSRFFRSGAIQENQTLSGLLSGGGETYNLPFWKDTVGTSGDIPSETVDSTVNAVGTGKQIFRKQTREKAWGENDLTEVYAGASAVQAAAGRVSDYWTQAWDIQTVKSAQGVFADNIANDGGDLVNDISAEAGALSNFSDDAVIDTQALLGENGVLGRGDQPSGEYVGILVHPAVYAYMRKLDLIDYVPISGQPRPLPFYMNMEVIVDRNAPETTGVYDSIIFKAGAFQVGQTANGYLPTELYRRPYKGFGIDELWTRRTYGIHPVGTAWQEASVAGVTPTDAELATATNWDRVFEKENMRMVALKHKIDQV